RLRWLDSAVLKRGSRTVTTARSLFENDHRCKSEDRDSRATNHSRDHKPTGKARQIVRSRRTSPAPISFGVGRWRWDGQGSVLALPLETARYSGLLFLPAQIALERDRPALDSFFALLLLWL